jgi:hypothetical protein
MKARFGQNCGTLLNGRQGQGALTVCSMVPEGKLTSVQWAALAKRSSDTALRDPMNWSGPAAPFSRRAARA